MYSVNMHMDPMGIEEVVVYFTVLSRNYMEMNEEHH
jgi:hypothetical protein